MTATMIVQELNTLVQDIRITTIDDVTFVIVTNSPIVLATASIAAGSNLDKSKIIEIQVEYEATISQTLIFEYSSNSGLTWSTFATRAIIATNKPTILSVVRSITAHGLQLRLRSTTLGTLRLLAFIPRIVQEARVFS